MLDQVSITDNKITTHVSNADLQIDTDGTGTIQILTNTNVSGVLTATSLTTNEITSNGSNADLSIQPSGTGDVLISALRVNGTTLDSSDSTKITIAEAVDVTGALAVAGQTTLTGSFLPAIHTFTATDAITEIEHAGRTLLLLSLIHI